jgi:hypothetical protein
VGALGGRMNIVKDLRCTADGILPPAAHYELIFRP